jgi:pimeloyl-ACP methyl ester carboxylesterase
MIIFLNCIHKNLSSFWLSAIVFKIEGLTNNKVTITTHQKDQIKIMKKSKLFIALFVIMLLNLISLGVYASEKQQRKIASNTWELYYYNSLPYKLMRPINFDSTKKYPVVICLHGAAQMNPDTVNFSAGTYAQQLALPQVRLDYPAYILVPKTSKLWNLNDLANIKAIITGLPSVDMNRIYVVGHSAGGQGTLLFIENEPQYFAAAIACSAFGVRVKNRQVLINFNLWSMHGDADSTVPYDKDYPFFTDMKTLNARMKFTTYFGFKHGQTDEYIFGINGIDPTVTPLTADQFKTEFAGSDSDPEPDTLVWLFSKRSSGALGVNDIFNDKQELNLYPNPTHSVVNWTTSTNIDQVVVNDSNGKVLLKVTKPTANSIDMSMFTNGMYFINFYQNDTSVFTKKIIKK